MEVKKVVCGTLEVGGGGSEYVISSMGKKALSGGLALSVTAEFIAVDWRLPTW